MTTPIKKKQKTIIYDINHNYANRFKDLCEAEKKSQAEVLRELVADFITHKNDYDFKLGAGKKSQYDKKTTFMLNLDLAEQLKEIAMEREDSVSKIVRMLVRSYINTDETLTSKKA